MFPIVHEAIVTVSRAAVPVLLVLFHLQGSPGADRPVDRTLTVPGGPGRPSFTLHIQEKGREGVVEVFSSTGGRHQTLTCAIELPALFVDGFKVQDLDMDGYPDLSGTREFGAKWERSCIWLFDPSSQWFVRDFLAEQMELLVNLQVDSVHHRLISSTIGPTDPSWDVYRIVNGSHPRMRVLLPERACVIETGETGNVAAIVTRYSAGQAQTERHLLPPSDQRGVQEICDALEGTGQLNFDDPVDVQRDDSLSVLLNPWRRSLSTRR